MTPSDRLTAEILLAVSKEFPYVVLWRNNRIDAMAVGAGGTMRRVKAGIDGQGDLTGIALSRSGVGLRLEIEVKTGKDGLSKAQRRFRNMIVQHGGIYIVARNVEDTLAALGQYSQRNRQLRDHQEPGQDGRYTGI